MQDFKEFTPETEDDKNDRSVAELLEKYVILDFLYDEYVSNYFIQLRRFPFELSGYDNQFLKLKPDVLQLLWFGLKDRYQKKLNKAIPKKEKKSTLATF